jgi:SAM-dependent methyltransferase
MTEKEILNSKYWEDLRSKSALAGITLDEDINPRDFETYGNRLAERQLSIIEDHGLTATSSSRILDLGCGIGRISRPFSDRFSEVVGVDINAEILAVAKEYIGEKNNVSLIENDGRTIPFQDNHFDYVYCGGVLQHIPDIDVIAGYFSEGLRVLKPNGILNFSIQTWMTSRVGGISSPRIGAMVLAKDIDTLLNETGHKLIAIYDDVEDPVPHFNIVLSKRDPVAAQKSITSRASDPVRISSNDVTPRKLRTGIFEDLPSYTQLSLLWVNGRKRPITFFTAPEPKSPGKLSKNIKRIKRFLRGD